MTQSKPKKVKKQPKWPDYKRFDTGEVITFGTNIFMRKDGQAIRILFPLGNVLELSPIVSKKKKA